MFKDLTACCAGPRKAGGVERGKSIGTEKPPEATPTVSISCTMLILECKLECAQRGDRMLSQLDELYAKYKNKELEPNDALAQLTKLVGETCVEQAALVLNNEHDPKCDLQEGWIEYYDDAQQVWACPRIDQCFAAASHPPTHPSPRSCRTTTIPEPRSRSGRSLRGRRLASAPRSRTSSTSPSLRSRRSPATPAACRSPPPSRSTRSR